MSYITISELAVAADCSRNTIERWIRLGLLSKPRMALARQGIGRRGLWPGNMIARAQEIRRLQIEEGLTLSDVGSGNSDRLFPEILTRSAS